MKNNKGNIKLEDLDGNSKKNNFEVPNNYFASLKDDIEKKINVDSDSILSGDMKKNNFKVPPNYHSAFKVKFEKELIENAKTPVTSNLRMMYYTLGAVAAVFIGLILLNLPSSGEAALSEKNSSVSVSVEEYQNSLIEEVENYNPLIAMVSGGENESEYDYIFDTEVKEVTTVADIQDLFIDELEDLEYDY
ncbi:MAG: hypothetical protein ACI8Q1_000499 [Parvicella sp.]|jgi:hypothetical protein